MTFGTPDAVAYHAHHNSLTASPSKIVLYTQPFSLARPLLYGYPIQITLLIEHDQTTYTPKISLNLVSETVLIVLYRWPAIPIRVVKNVL